MISIGWSTDPVKSGAIVFSHVRGHAIALLFIGATLLGLGIGPTAIALMTDQVCGRDPMALRYAIPIVAVSCINAGNAVTTPLGSGVPRQVAYPAYFAAQTPLTPATAKSTSAG
jgi:hypothetical protein